MEPASYYSELTVEGSLAALGTPVSDGCAMSGSQCHGR